MKMSVLIGKYMGLVIRNSKSKFEYDGTTDRGHMFTSSDNRRGFIISEDALNMFLTGKQFKADFKVTKGIFWIEKQNGI